MKSYTFKVKFFNTKTNVYETILSIHMPLEAFFESVKVTPHLKDFSEKNTDSIVTCSDYYFYTDTNDLLYNDHDLLYCNLSTLVNAQSFRHFLIDDDVKGTLPEYPIPNEDVLSDPVDVFNDEVCEVL